MDFGARLRQLRKEAGQSQEQLAAQLHTTKAAISRYERGDRNPSFSVIALLAKEFHVPESYFFDGDYHKQENSKMNYERVLDKPLHQEELILISKSEKELVLDLIHYFQEKGYSHKEAHRIMKLAGSTMRCAALEEKV